MTPRTPLTRALALTLAVCLAAAAHAAVIPRSEAPYPHALVPEPRRVEVELAGRVTTAALLRAGFDLIDLREGAATLLEWPGDADRLSALGASVRVLDEHPGRSAARAAAAELGSAAAPRGRARPE